MSLAKTLIAVLVVAAFLPALAIAQGSRTEVSCHATFSHQPVHTAGGLAYNVVAVNKSHTAAALSCARGKAVIQAAFTTFGKKTLNYRNVGKIAVTVSRAKYSFALPKPMASGSYAWTGAGTRVQYGLPTGG